MLTWAFNETGDEVEAKDVRNQPRALRPRCLCPSCKREMGAVRSPLGNFFFRHESEADPCYATNPEGALHLEAKRLLREHLSHLAREQQPLEVSYPCADCTRPVSARTPPLQSGDVIKEEEWMDPLKTRKPDLTAWRTGAPIALYELVATNPCGDEKWSELKACGLPVIEVLAGVVAGDGTQPAWSRDTPLPIERALGFDRPHLCAECQAKREQERQRRAAMKAAEKAERRRHFETRHEHVIDVWFIDFHFPDGKRVRRRMVFLAIEHRGQWEHRLLGTEGQLVKSWGPTPTPDPNILELAAQVMRERIEKAYPQAIRRIQKYDLLIQPESAAAALKLNDPMPLLWWDAEGRRWVEGYSLGFMRKQFPARWRLKVWVWVKSGLIPIIQVRACAGASKSRELAEKQLVDALAAYAHAQGPCPERLQNPPPDIKRRMDRIEERYKSKQKRKADQQATAIAEVLASSQPPRPSPQLSTEEIRKRIWGRRR